MLNNNLQTDTKKDSITTLIEACKQFLKTNTSRKKRCFNNFQVQLYKLLLIIVSLRKLLGRELIVYTDLKHLAEMCIGCVLIILEMCICVSLFSNQ